VTIEWGAANRPKHGQSVSGDTYAVVYPPDGSVIVTVIDGLGGGEEAARAARLAEQVVRDHNNWTLQEQITTMHTALHGTRGAVIGMLRLEPNHNRASYVGVGNIGAHVYSRQPIKPISKNGIIGFRLPALLELRYTYEPGDIFVLYSDGITARFGQDAQLDIKQPPQALADRILQQYGKTVDDATVVVVKT
jgi:serine/threonine protein phosphatase PrpC